MESELVVNGDNVELLDGERKKIKHGVITVEPVLAVVFLAQALSDSVLTELFLKRTCEVQLHLNASFCGALGTNTTQGHDAESIVQPHVASYLMWKSVLQSVVPAVFSLFLGPWSDKYGRKPIIVLSLTGCGLMYVVYVILAYIPNLHPAALLLGIFPFSLMGGYVNLIATSVCFVSDISSVDQRVFRLVILEGFLMAGELVGLPLAGILFATAEKINLGHLASFGLCAALCFLALVYVVWFINESIVIREQSAGWSRLFNIEHPKEMWRTCFQQRAGYRRLVILLCAFVLASGILVLEGEAQISFLYKRLQFGWDLEQSTNVSAILLAIYVVGGVIGCWLLPKLFKISDAGLSIFAYATDIANNVLKTLAGPRQSYFLFIGGGISALKAVIGPAVRSILSKTIPAEDIGKVFAFTFALESILPIASGPLYAAVYNATIPSMPGAVFLLSSGIYFVNILMLLIVAVIQKRYHQNE